MAGPASRLPRRAPRARRMRRGSASSMAPYAPVRKIEMMTIGQNSPAIPAPSTPTRERRQQPGVDEIGTSVPSAVVLKATPSSHHSASTPAALNSAPTESPIARETAQPAAPPRRPSPDDASLDDLEPREEEEQRKAEIREEADGSHLGWSPDLRADDIRERSRRRPSAGRSVHGSSRRSHRAPRRRGRRRGIRRSGAATAWPRTAGTPGSTIRRAEPRYGTMPQRLVVDSPGSSPTRPSPLRKAFGAQVMGSTAILPRATSGSGSPVNSIK